MKIGDWEFLASHIESGGDIDAIKGLRQFLAGVLRGQTRRSANRTPALRTECRKYAIAQAASHGGIDRAMEEFNVNRRTVQRCVKEYKHILEKDPASLVNLWLYQRGYYHIK
jgi:hypothetical protein